MMWNFANDSSESEDDSRDKFRSERVLPKNSKNVKSVLEPLDDYYHLSNRDRTPHSWNSSKEKPSKLKSSSDISSLRNIDDQEGGRSTSKYCNNCDYRLSRCKCELTSYWNRPIESKEYDVEGDRKSSRKHIEKLESDKSKSLYIDESSKRKSHKRKSKDKDKHECKNSKCEKVEKEKRKDKKSPSSELSDSKQQKAIVVDMSTDNRLNSDVVLRTLAEPECSKIKDDINHFGPSLPPKLNKSKLEDGSRNKICKKKSKHKAPSESDVQNIQKDFNVKKEFQEKSSKDDKSQQIVSEVVENKAESIEKKNTEDGERYRVYGPSKKEDFEEGELVDEDHYGPKLPPTMDREREEEEEMEVLSGDEDEFMGPAAPGTDPTPTHIALNHRAALLKIHMQNKESGEKEVVKRESWMLELPNKKLADRMGLVPRNFKTRDSGKIDPTWTETPSEKKKRELALKSDKEKTKADDDHKRKKDVFSSKRDKEMEKYAKKVCKSSREKKSLLEMHQDKIKSKKKSHGNKEDKPERKPFSREDLHVNVFSDSQKKAIFRKAQVLDSRFSSGSNKYL